MTRKLITGSLVLLIAVAAWAQVPPNVYTRYVTPDEEVWFCFDTSPLVGTSETVATFTVDVEQRGADNDPDADGLITSTNATGQCANVLVVPTLARNKKDYDVHVLATMNTGQKLAVDGVIRVRWHWIPG